jgi:vacuolar protein sorting-associated protein 13B
LTNLFFLLSISEWSRGLDVSVEQETFISLPGHGDVKIVMASPGPATRLALQPVSDMEIAAKDIRARFDQPAKPLPHPTSARELSDTCSTSSSAHSFVMVETAGVGKPETGLNTTAMTSAASLVFTLVLKIKEVGLALTDDLVNFEDIQEVVRITASEVKFLYLPDLVDRAVKLAAESDTSLQKYSLSLEIGDLQADNQIYDRGLYHFPVLFYKQEAAKQPLLSLNLTLCETAQQRFLRTVHVALSPVCVSFEDTLYYALKEYIRQLINVGSAQAAKAVEEGLPMVVAVAVNSSRSFYYLDRIIIEPIQLQMSVHASVKLFLGLEGTQLQLGRFERSAVWSSGFGMGGILSHHYLSGALFKAGWVVGSLDVIGSPATFTRNVSEGLKDFIALPCEGIFNGPWGFILGLSQGSSSLVKHVSAGTITSLTNFCQSVSRNLDMVTFDAEHSQRNEAVRRAKPKGLSEGIMKGLSGIGVSLLGAIGGLAHHPIQAFIHQGLSPMGLVGGVSKGIVGIVAKPLGGAAEFIAQTGQGLLAGSGWIRERRAKRMSLPAMVLDQPSAQLKFSWKMPEVGRVLLSLEAVLQEADGQLFPVTCLVTTDSLVIINDEEDAAVLMYSVRQLSAAPSAEDPTLVRLAVHKLVEEEEEELLRTTDRTAQFVLQSIQFSGLAAGLSEREEGRATTTTALLGGTGAELEAEHQLFLNPGLVEWFVIGLESARLRFSHL